MELVVTSTGLEPSLNISEGSLLGFELEDRADAKKHHEHADDLIRLTTVLFMFAFITCCWFGGISFCVAAMLNDQKIAKCLPLIVQLWIEFISDLVRCSAYCPAGGRSSVVGGFQDEQVRSVGHAEMNPYTQYMEDFAGGSDRDSANRRPSFRGAGYEGYPRHEGNHETFVI